MDRGIFVLPSRRRLRWYTLAILTVLALGKAGSADEANGTSAATESHVFSAPDLEFFEMQVRPLLARRCYQCHSDKAKELKGGLRLDSRVALLAGGDTGPALVPGDEKQSLLIDAINYGDLYQMPPKSKLPAAEIAVLTKWVKLGAPWPPEGPAALSAKEAFDLAARKQDHWCWHPLSTSLPPAVKQQDWPRNDIDRFILSRLEQNGLSPALPAEKSTLIRRAYFDLIGLPPTAEQVQAFLDDDSPEAFERIVDQLLDSQDFGERWARHWMDLMRYAETHGHEFDYPIHHAAKYRDYLIRAFNADVPYDQFVREHLAGDLLDPPRRHPESDANESVLATGFWFLGEATHAPVDVRGDQAGRLDNQIDVMTKAFLGLTVACARCHDHKFDAITTTDYYALTGFLKSSHREEVLLDPGNQIARASQELAKIQDAGTKLISRASGQLSGKMFARYLLAAREVMQREPAVGNAAADEPRVVFEDFEGPDYGDWKATGTAFGAGPQSAATTPAYQGNLAAHGRQWVNSHETRPGGDVGKGDHHKGRLTSPEFTINHRLIEFLVGGGRHPGKTCLNLLVGDAVVRTQTGFNSNQMRPARFEVSELIGQTARLEIVDDQTGGWGNIGVDHIVFAGRPRLLHQAVIEEVARQEQLDAGQLARWVVALSEPDIKQPSHPLYAWSVLAPAPSADNFNQFRQRVAKNEQEILQRDRDYPLVEEFSDLDGWHRGGHAFADLAGREPPAAAAGDWDPRHATARLLAAGVVDSGRYGGRQQGVLRSPTFTVTHKNLFYRLRGQNVKIRLKIDGYFMDTFNGLLFRGFAFDVKSPDTMTWHRQSQDVARYLGHRGAIEISDHGDGYVALDEIRLSNLDQPPAEIAIVSGSLVTPAVNSLTTLADAYGRQWVTATDTANASGEALKLREWAVANKLIPLAMPDIDSLRKWQEEWATLEKTIPQPEKVLGIADGSAEPAHVYIRGNHRTLGPEVPRQLLEAVVGRRPIETAGSGRLQLAEQILSEKNPLVSRVIVNRLWHHVFGRGIVASVDNFGVLGSRPTHTELLDFLARNFRQDWSIKNALRSMLLSATYQMASTPSDKGNELDPNNHLLHRMRIRRLQGEAIRDSILAISKRLNRTRYGASVPINITPFMQGRGRPGRSGPLDGDGRRSLYIEVRRNFLSPMMLAFDTPIPFNAVGRRNVSNVPAQALIMMNDPFVVAQAQRWADEVLKKPDSVEARIERLYVAAFARPPDTDELAAAEAFLEEFSQQIGTSDPNDKRVWANLCHVLMNVKEFVFIH